MRKNQGEMESLSFIFWFGATVCTEISGHKPVYGLGSEAVKKIRFNPPKGEDDR